MQKDCWTWWWHMLRFSWSLFLPPSPLGKFVAETPSVHRNGSQTQRWLWHECLMHRRPWSGHRARVWSEDGCLRSVCGAAVRRSGDRGATWPEVQAGGTATTVMTPLTCRGAHGLLWSLNPQGMHAPIRIPKIIFVRSLCNVIPQFWGLRRRWASSEGH